MTVMAVALVMMWKVRGDEEALLAGARDTRRTGVVYEKFIESRSRANEYLGMRIPRVQLRNVNGGLVSTDLTGRAGGLLLVFSPLRGCQFCLATQLRLLQRVHMSIRDPSQFLIIALSDAEVDSTRQLETEFDLDYPLVSDTTGVLLNEVLVRATPLVLLVDDTGTVISAHTTTLGKPEFSILFFHQLLAWQMKRHLGVEVNDSADLGLRGVPVLSVIRGESVDGRARDLLY